MIAPITRESVTDTVETLTTWWIGRRTEKIQAAEHASMEVNPFLAPLICALHGLKNPRELAQFVTAGHFYIGHGTGFGKLIDEKILPQAFGTVKLDKEYRKANGLIDPAFDDIDHIVVKPDGRYLLSQKASKWTIQLGQANGLNDSFKKLIDLRDSGKTEFKKIIVGVFYGHADDLTDKYRLIRGVITGAAHDVVDITANVDVYAGKAFWGWLAGNDEAQQWVMSGIFRAIEKSARDEADAQQATVEIERELTGMLARLGDVASEDDWLSFIEAVNR